MPWAYCQVPDGSTEDMAAETKEDSVNTHPIAAKAESIGFWRGVAGLEALVLVGAVAIILVSRAPVGRAQAVLRPE